MIFIGTGNDFYTSYRPFFAKSWHIEFFFRTRIIIYMRMQKKKSISDSWVLVRSAVF